MPSGLIDYAQMARGLLGDYAAPVAMKNPLQSKMLDPRGGTEGAIGYGGGASPKAAKPLRRDKDLMPAVQYQDGSTLAAPRPGMQHFEIYEMGAQAGRGAARDTGYVNIHTGEFIPQHMMYGWKR
jgi:hypothetical protein